VTWSFPVLQIQPGPNLCFTGAEDLIAGASQLSKAEEKVLGLPWPVTLDPALDWIPIPGLLHLLS